MKDLVDKVEALMFNSTSSKSHRLNEACILLEQLLKCDILFFECYHYIFQLDLQVFFAHMKVNFMNGLDIFYLNGLQITGQILIQTILKNIL